jgi:hypothetical protein
MNEAKQSEANIYFSGMKRVVGFKEQVQVLISPAPLSISLLLLALSNSVKKKSKI